MSEINVLFPTKGYMEDSIDKTENRGQFNTLKHLVRLLYNIKEMRVSMDSVYKEFFKDNYRFSERYMEVYFDDLYSQIKKVKYHFGW